MAVTNERLIELHYMLEKVTDEELLMAARHRGLLGRVDHHEIIPGWAIHRGAHPPDEYIFTRMGRSLGERMSILSLPGKKVEEGNFLGSDYHTPDRKLTLVYNFVVEK